MPAWVQMVRNVELFRRAWLGIVRGVCVPSGLSLTKAICSRSLTIRKPRDPSAFKTLFLGASIGNFTLSCHPSFGNESFQYGRLVF